MLTFMKAVRTKLVPRIMVEGSEMCDESTDRKPDSVSYIANAYNGSESFEAKAYEADGTVHGTIFWSDHYIQIRMKESDMTLLMEKGPRNTAKEFQTLDALFDRVVARIRGGV